LLIADEPRSFAQQVLRVLDDRELAAALGAGGRALAESEFSWRIVGQQLADFYAKLVGHLT
jgi:glycosyltransferase involved in cell wall biosynthesis